MMPFFVSRQIYTGAGKVGAENNSDPCDYQISQRADFLETEVGLETMHSRPIINTRDEPHADPEKYRRLHVIVGDANMSETTNYLKCGTMAIVLSMVEDDFIDRDFSIDGPVGAYRLVSRDLACRETFRLKDGRSLSAIDLQREFLALAYRYYKDREHEPWVRDVLAKWESVLDRLADDPMQLGRELDWVIKRQLIENYIEKHDLDWRDSRVQMIDLQYHDIRPGKGLYYKLEGGAAEEDLHAGAPPRDGGARAPAPDRVSDGGRPAPQHLAAQRRRMTFPGRGRPPSRRALPTTLSATPSRHHKVGGR
jgi:proteasome accessory factor A